SKRCWRAAPGGRVRGRVARWRWLHRTCPVIRSKDRAIDEPEDRRDSVRWRDRIRAGRLANRDRKPAECRRARRGLRRGNRREPAPAGHNSWLAEKPAWE